MKLYSKIIILVLLSFPFYSFSQDPGCEFNVIIRNIDDTKYDYNILLEYDYEKVKIDSIRKGLESNWEFNSNIWVESSLLKSKANNKIIVGYLSDYCYPISSLKNQLRITIARKGRKEKDVELMYTTCKLVPGRTEILIEEFRHGQRENEVFEFHEDYLNNENVDYGHKQYLSLNSRKIFIK